MSSTDNSLFAMLDKHARNIDLVYSLMDEGYISKDGVIEYTDGALHYARFCYGDLEEQELKDIIESVRELFGAD